MNDKRSKLIGLVLVLVCIITILSIAIIFYSSRNKINPDTVQITPNDFYCPFGEATTESTVVNFENATELCREDYEVKMLLLDMALSFNATLDNIKDLIQLINDTQQKKQIEEMKQIEIPKNANYFGSKNINPITSNQLPQSDLSLDLMNSDIRIYAWNTDYMLYSKKTGRKTKLILTYNDILLYFEIQTLGQNKGKIFCMYATNPTFF